MKETWAVEPTNLLKKKLTYSSIFKAYFKKIFAVANASLVFIKNRCKSNRSQMFFKIGLPITISAGLQVLSCEYCEIFKSSFFYKTTPVAASADVLFYMFSKRRCICCTTCCHSLSFIVPLVVIRCHSLPIVVQLDITQCTTRLSLYKRSFLTLVFHI